MGQNIPYPQNLTAGSVVTNSSADHLLQTPLQAVPVTKHDTSGGFETIWRWMILPLGRGLKQCGQCLALKKGGNEDQVRTLFRPSFLVSSSLIFSVITSPSGRTSLLGMREAEEAPANLAKDDKGTSSSGGGPARSSRNPHPAVCFPLNSQALLPGKEKLD